MRTLYFCPVVSSSSIFFFFLTSSQPMQIGCVPYLHTWCGLSANLRCRSETCCKALGANTGRKKSSKKSPSGHHHTTLSGYIFATEARIDSRKKLVKQQYLLHVFPQYGKLRPTSGWDRSGSLGHPCKFQWVSCLGSVTARQSSIGCREIWSSL